MSVEGCRRRTPFQLDDGGPTLHGDKMGSDYGHYLQTVDGIGEACHECIHCQSISNGQQKPSLLHAVPSFREIELGEASSGDTKIGPIFAQDELTSYHIYQPAELDFQKIEEQVADDKRLFASGNSESDKIADDELTVLQIAKISPVLCQNELTSGYGQAEPDFKKIEERAADDKRLLVSERRETTADDELTKLENAAGVKITDELLDECGKSATVLGRPRSWMVIGNQLPPIPALANLLPVNSNWRQKTIDTIRSYCSYRHQMSRTYASLLHATAAGNGDEDDDTREPNIIGTGQNESNDLTADDDDDLPNYEAMSDTDLFELLKKSLSQANQFDSKSKCQLMRLREKLTAANDDDSSEDDEGMVTADEFPNDEKNATQATGGDESWNWPNIAALGQWPRRLVSRVLRWPFTSRS